MKIMPSGKSTIDIFSKNFLKTASAENGEEQEVADPLFEIAKQVVANQHCAGGDDLVVEEDGVVFEGEPAPVEVSDEVADSDAAACLDRAVEAIEDAKECLGEDDEFEAEVDLNVVDESPVEDDVVESGQHCMASEEQEVVEAKKDEECDDDEEECDDDMEKEASSDNFVKLSAISPTNRKKIYDYWAKYLDYPKDFVKLMVKDYEK